MFSDNLRTPAFRLAALIIFAGALSFSVKAQADCGFDLSLSVRNKNGATLQNAKVSLSGSDLSFNGGKNAFTKSSVLGVGTKYQRLLTVSADGFEDFETGIEIACGRFSYELTLKSKGADEPAVFEELANVQGKVVDASGAVVPNTRVILTNEKGLRTQTFTNDYGYFFFETKSGTYSLEFISAYSGFKPKRLENFRLVKGYNNLNVVLEVKSCEEMNDCHWVEGIPVQTNKKP